MTAEPVETPVTTPPEDTEAEPEALEDQVTCEVMSCEEPSLYTPCAVSC